MRHRRKAWAAISIAVTITKIVLISMGAHMERADFLFWLAIALCWQVTAFMLMARPGAGK